MVDEHAHSDQGISPKSKSMSLSRARRQTLFGEPLLLEGEDPAAYDDLRGEVRAAVKPADIIDEMFTVDVVFLALGGLAVAPSEIERDPKPRT